LLCVATAIPSPAQTFTSLLSFDITDGGDPDAPLAQGLDGNLYGTNYGGGSDDAGTIYKITPSGTLTTLYSFACEGESCHNGADPYAGVVLATDGYLYGTATAGGAHDQGTVFKINSRGDFTLLHGFAYKQGRNPYGGLVRGSDGNLYGTTERGGARNGGTVFKITPSGELTTLYNFCSQTNCTDGEYPYAALVQATDGNFYGTTLYGGTSVSDCGALGCGTIFEITPGGSITTLYNFCSQSNCTDGANPRAGMVQAAGGDFYGTASAGGSNNLGTVFKISTGGSITTLYSFCSQTNCADGSVPTATLVQATDGSFYGTTWDSAGGSNFGTVFKITRSGALTTLHSFDRTDGSYPYAGLVQATNGSFYGTTSSGGATGVGTVFKLSVGLGPFVEPLPTSGSVGATVIILGTKLTGTTAVSFNGIAATFTVVSGTEITTTVPGGATTGFVTVTTPSGKLKSNKKFRIVS
jgi:uncharacterized repeat protein (TIGR03803 family)